METTLRNEIETLASAIAALQARTSAVLQAIPAKPEYECYPGAHQGGFPPQDIDVARDNQRVLPRKSEGVRTSHLITCGETRSTRLV